MTWTTPRLLKAGGAAVTLAAILLMLAVIMGARAHRRDIQIIGKDSAPSIVAAQQIGAALSAMDAAAGDEDRRQFDARRIEAVSAIVTAAENITYGDAERAPIRSLAVGVGTYAAMVQNARDKRDIELYRQAAGFMDRELLPAAAALEKANYDALAETWAQQTAASRRALFMTIAGGLLLGGVLVALQIFLARRMRRVLNSGLFAAMIAAWIFVVFVGQAFNRADRDLRVAKEDAFDSMLALWDARALAYSANGDLSRARLDPARAALHQTAFTDKDRRIRAALTKGLNNITLFAGEREAAEETRERYMAWVEHKTAAADFSAFDDALGKTLKVNRTEFEASVQRGFTDVAGFEIIAPVVTLAICGMAWLGLRPRLREYSL